MKPPRDCLALAAAAAAGIQVGAAIVASRAVVAEIGPASLAALRYVIALVCLLPLVIAAGRVRAPPRDLAAIVVLGVLQMGLLVGLLNWGLGRTTASRASLLFCTFPVLTMLVAAALGRERIRLSTAIGLAVTLAGVAAVLGEGLGTEGSDREGAGVAAILLAALIGAICAVLYRPYLQLYPGAAVSAVAMSASVVALAPFALAEGTWPGWPTLGLGGWTAVLFIGASSAVGFALWFWALRTTTPTRVTAFMALSPVTSVALGVGLLGEALTLSIVLGLFGVAGGLWIATRPSTTGREPAC